MNFDLTEEQRLLQQSLRGWLSRNYDFDSRRAAAVDGGFRADVWQGLASELGLFGAALPEEVGGFGGGAVETLVVGEEIGRALLLEPYLECVVLGAALLSASSDEAAQALLRQVIDGAQIIVPALYEREGRFDYTWVETKASAVDGGPRLSGAKAAVVGAPLATHIIVSACDEAAGGKVALFLVDATAVGLAQRRYSLIDGRPAADLTLQDVPAHRLDYYSSAAPAFIEQAVAQAIACLCAEAVGVMEAMLDATLDYANQREQFGTAIAKFQAIQHKIADMLSMVERSRSLAIMATVSLGLPAAERNHAVSAAKVFIDRALQSVSEAAVQVHGGIGTTDELAISHYFKRARTMLSLLGDRTFHLHRMAASA